MPRSTSYHPRKPDEKGRFNMVATTDQKARLLDLTTGVLELVRDGKRDADEVCGILQIIKERRDFKQVLLGHVEVEHIIDCDADPFVPNGWQVEKHIKGGQFDWDPTKIDLYLSEIQQNGKVIKGDDLSKKLKGKLVLNACVLDYLLAHPELIPESWKGKYVFFWGTIYRYSGGGLYVRCLRWSGDGWDWGRHWLGGGFDGDGPVAVRASSS